MRQGSQRLVSFSIALFLLLLLAAGPARPGTVEDGLAAFDHLDFDSALRLLQPLAHAGDPIAQTKLGLMYAYGWGVPQDYVAAAKWFTPAAHEGVAEAQYELGKLWVEGWGVPQNDAEMVKWHSLAAGQGFVHAMNAMGE